MFEDIGKMVTMIKRRTLLPASDLKFIPLAALLFRLGQPSGQLAAVELAKDYVGEIVTMRVLSKYKIRYVNTDKREPLRVRSLYLSSIIPVFASVLLSSVVAFSADATGLLRPDTVGASPVVSGSTSSPPGIYHWTAAALHSARPFPMPSPAASVPTLPCRIDIKGQFSVPPSGCIIDQHGLQVPKVTGAAAPSP